MLKTTLVRPFLCALASMMVWGLAPAAPAQIVPIETGDIRGSTQEGVTAFKGIPFAAAATGENRWRSPQPAAAWDGVRDALTFGNDCMQVPSPDDAAPLRTEPSEDCLYINVWKPAGARAGAKLPVMVWYYGGGFVNGGTSPAIYDGSAFARDGVILVSANYRLGRFGFFAHPALAAEGFGGNFGFEDQIAALQWVSRNVAAFGGDPDNVTIFGESAGGISMHMMLQSPKARGLFDKVIIQSGGGRPSAIPMGDMVTAVQTGERFAPGASADDLREMPAARIKSASLFAPEERGKYSGPIIDGRTVISDWLPALRAGMYADVPVIVGTNSADGFPVSTDKDVIFATFGDDEEEARTLYDPSGNTSGLEVATMTSADRVFVEPARTMARDMSGLGHDVWLYRFAHVGTKLGQAMGGAPHAREIPYVFKTTDNQLDAIGAVEDKAVAEITHRYWVQFAKTGEPAGPGLPAWPKADAETTSVQFIASDGARHVEDPRTASVDFAQRRLGAEAD